MFLIKKKRKRNEKLKFNMFILKSKLEQLHQQGKKLLICCYPFNVYCLVCKLDNILKMLFHAYQCTYKHDEAQQ